MDTSSSPQVRGRPEQARSRLQEWFDRLPLWTAQIIAVVITWICVGACVLLFVAITGMSGS